MKRSEPIRDFTLTDLIALPQLQEMQDSFAEVANVAIRTLDAVGNSLTQMSSAPSLCTEAFGTKRIRQEVCEHCRPAFLGGHGFVDEDLSFECFLGLRNYLVPLKLPVSDNTSRILGYIVVGPVIFMKRRNKEDYAAAAAEWDIDPEQLWSYILELRVFSFKGIRSFLEMIGNLMSRMLNLAHSARSIEVEMSQRMKSRMVRPSRDGAENCEEFLKMFLNMVSGMVGSSASSVMLLDSSKQVLGIKASEGLNEEIVRSTSLRMGEGVAGLSASTKKSFLITDECRDADVSERLKKPELSSSIVVPICCRDEVLGVLNVARDRTARVVLNEKDLSLLTKAAGLAGMALDRIRN